MHSGDVLLASNACHDDRVGTRLKHNEHFEALRSREVLARDIGAGLLLVEAVLVEVDVSSDGPLAREKTLKDERHLRKNKHSCLQNEGDKRGIDDTSEIREERIRGGCR